MFRVVGFVRTVGVFLHVVKTKNIPRRKLRGFIFKESAYENLTLQILLGIYILSVVGRR